MAKVAVQLGDFFMVNMIEADRLINGCASKDWEDRKDERFRLDSEAIPRNGCEKKNQDNRHEKANLLFHLFSLFVSPRICQVKIGRECYKSSTGRTQ
jgi:hypothetical protein